MTMLQLAVKAQLPLIAVSTRDTLNLMDVLKTLTKRTPVRFFGNTEIAPDQLYVFMLADGAKLPLFELYPVLVKAESTLILVNPSRVMEPMFDAGEVPTPKSMLLKFMHNVTQDMGAAQNLSRALGGVTLKEAAELARLTMARDASLTVPGITDTRKTSFQGANGLTQVDPRQVFYDAPAKLATWAKKERMFFLDAPDPRLMPRGLLFDGPPGTGKTAGAKYLAEQWGVPLFRVDIGGTKNKYVGQSEANLINNLTRLDHEEPCIALIDEVEKVFASSTTDTSGTTSSMLSQMLWWLAERQSKVMVIMTTNNAKALPKELYREGRINETMIFDGLFEDEVEPFVTQVFATFKKVPVQVTPEVVKAVLKHAVAFKGSMPVKYSQATLTEAVYTYIKETLNNPSLLLPKS